MEHTSLASYVASRIEAGLSKVEIKEQLISVGWSEDEVDAAYSGALIDQGVPTPENSTRQGVVKKSSTVEIVVNFFSFILLGIVATSLGTLFYEIISYYFPDELLTRNSYYYNRYEDTIHYAIAALVIAFPLYYASVRLWFKRFREDEAKTESRLTKWLTYIVLLIAAITIVGDLIVTLFTFLQGEITMRFFLKALTILAIAGIIFGFYFLERKKIQYRRVISRSVFNALGFTVAAFIIIGIVLGFLVAGSPTTARMQGFDDQRSQDLSSLARCIEGYARAYGRLPSALSELERTTLYDCRNNTKDPETGQLYEYGAISPLKTTGVRSEGEFRLCAGFSLASKVTDQLNGYNDNKWYEHGVGRSCDTVSVVVNIKNY